MDTWQCVKVLTMAVMMEKLLVSYEICILRSYDVTCKTGEIQDLYYVIHSDLRHYRKR